MNTNNPFPYLHPTDETGAAPEPVSQGTDAMQGNDVAAAEETLTMKPK
jgi:hypothetical protein